MGSTETEAAADTPYWIFADYSQYQLPGNHRDNAAVGPFPSREAAVLCGDTWGMGIGTIIASAAPPAPIIYSPEEWAEHQKHRI